MRISRIDNLKWIWILLIVLGHCKLPIDNTLTKYLFSFHVALFFILSWFLFDWEKYNKFIKFFKSRFLRLIIPFFAFNIIYFAINKSIWEYAWTTIRDFAVGVFYGDYLGDNWWIYNNTWWFNLWNISTWFLPALFFTSIYYFVLNKITKSNTTKIIVVFILSIAVYFESKFTNFRLPWSMEIAAMMLFFYTLWNVFKSKIKDFAEKIDFKYLWLIILILLIHLPFLNVTNISINNYWNYFLFLSNSLFWFLTFLIISKMIWDNNVLSFFWKNSIIILWFEWIKIFIEKYTDFFTFWMMHYEKTYLFWFTQFFITVLLLVPIIYIVNNFFPFILGFWYKYSIFKKYL